MRPFEVSKLFQVAVSNSSDLKYVTLKKSSVEKNTAVSVAELF